jgi:uracil-DNA glycosylase
VPLRCGAMAILAGMWFQQMHPLWQQALSGQEALLNRLEQSLSQLPNLAPRPHLVMAAFTADPSKVRVVIVGQDPYPTPGVAVGRSFAVSGLPVPASLRNMFKELASELAIEPTDVTTSLDLHGWQAQGVLLLNRHLTTLEGQAGAHFKEGWQAFTDAAIAHLLAANPLTVLVLWGNQAQQLKKTLAQAISDAGERAMLIEGVHPSPLSAHRGFLGSKPFGTINAALQSVGQEPINWLL